MKKTIAITTTHIDWRLKRQSPDYFYIGTEYKIDILNPIKFPELYTANDLVQWASELSETKELLFRTNGLILTINSNKDLDDIAQNIGNLLLPFYKVLRVVSKQYLINPSRLIYGLYPIETEIKKSKLNIQKIISVIYRKDYYTNRVTNKDIKKAISLFSNNYSIPIYDELFLDTLHDYSQGNYKKTILYSAITIEAFMAAHYDNEYSKLLNATKNRAFRINNNEHKDPIYEYIKKKNDFYSLLYELPLYLFNKSIKENKSLYERLDKLHKTRNKIVHLGDLVVKKSDANGYIEINEKGALEALHILVEALKYFNIDYSANIDFGFMKIK